MNKQRVLKYYIIIILALFANKALAQQYTEYDLKAAYIYNFSKFVSWPDYAFESDQTNFNIVVYGNSPITKVLFKALRNRKMLNRDVTIKVISRVEDIGNAHILYISKDLQQESKKIIAYTGNKPILLVGDVIETFCRMGGIINFTQKASKYRFEINNQAAQESKLRISSKLLALARIIDSEEIKF